MSESGSTVPRSLSDIPCESCGLYFRLDADLIAHREEHASNHSRSVHMIQGEFLVVLCGADNETWPCAAERARLSQGHGTDV